MQRTIFKYGFPYFAFAVRSKKVLSHLQESAKPHLFHLYLTNSSTLYSLNILILVFLIFLYSVLSFIQLTKAKKVSNTSLLYSFSIPSVYFYNFKMTKKKVPVYG